MKTLEEIERDASHPFLLEQEKRMREFWQKAGEAVTTGEQVYIGTWMGRDVWVTAQPPNPP